MADNLSQKSGKSIEKTKYSNAINRTTSETMRLGEPEKTVNHPTSLISSTPTQRKKTPSFQITSVTVGSRTSNDGGDDSADDLDESHTDDMSDVIDNSRITDIENETPSYSEDTFSKEDVFFNASTTSLGTAPVIPTSSQYGLAIVASEGGNNNNIINAAVACANTISSGDVHVSVTDTGNVIVGSGKPHETEMRDGHAHHTGRNERFKVVKIESTEPFKRGRWLCMDYLDHTMQQPSQQAVINVVRSNDSSDTIGSVQYVGPPDSGVVITDGPITLQSMDDQIITVDQSHLKSAAVSLQEHQAMVVTHQVNMGSLAPGQNTGGSTNFPSVSPGQTLQTAPVQQNQQHVQQQPPPVQPTMQQASIPQSLPQNIQQVVNQQQLQQQSQQTNTQNLQALPQHSQSMSQVSLQQNMSTVPQQQQQQQSVAQHQSLPPQQIQQVMATANLQQLQQQPHHHQIQQQQMQQQMPQQQVFAPQQPNQQAQTHQQHITSQPGQSQGQYYNIPSSTISQQVPISQGQSSIQLQPQTSISAQTQTIQTSTSSQPQVVTSMSMPMSHQMQQGAVSQIGQPTPQQQHNIQLQQQQYTQQIQAQSQLPPMQQQMQHQGITQQSMQQTMPQQAIPQQTMPQQNMPQQTMSQQSMPQQTIPQQNMSQQTMPQQSIPQQTMPPQTMTQQSMPQQQMQQPQQQIQQAQAMPQQQIQQPQALPQQTMQPPQAMASQSLPQQSLQQSQQTMPPPMQQQPVAQQGMSQQSMPQGTMAQVMTQPQQVMPQVLQSQPLSQVMQQPQQVIQQPQQTISQPAPQAMQPQTVLQQPQIHHSANMQNIQSQQMHVGAVSNIAQQPQTMQQAAIGQGMMPGHQMTVTGGGQPPQMVPVSSQMPQVSSVVSSVAQSFSHLPVSQATTAVSRTIQSGSVSVCAEGTVDHTNSNDASVALLESLVEVTSSSEDVQPSGVTAGEESESASGTSAVAIDNKIEQAMDLVKSHLMFAVREEVEVLKEKIAELMDRINQLELENTILKAHATQETLAQLGGNTTQQGNKNQQSQQPPNSSVS